MTFVGLLLVAGITFGSMDSISSARISPDACRDTAAASAATGTAGSAIVEQRTKWPWRAVAETAASNLAILAVDRYVLNKDFAKVTWHTIGRNFSLSKWYWDSDVFRTNLMLHPYHGSLYYNAARSNGMSYLEAIPFVVGGSLMWELAGEMEQPSINDFLTTSAGGLAIGEVTNRLSEMVYDEKARGLERVVREITGALVNPSGAITRLMDGKTFRVRKDSDSLYGKSVRQRAKMDMSLLLSGRYLGVWKETESRRLGSTLNLDILYGLPVSGANSKPYDFFRASIGVDFSGKESLVSNLNIIGQLKNWMLKETETNCLSLGIYQNFDYYCTDSIHAKTPYKISEAASIGIGLAWYRQLGRTRNFQELYVNGVILGGALSDYRANRCRRDYSIGSGCSLKSLTGFDYNNWLRLRLLADMKFIHSWKGYEDEDETKQYIEYSVMGDRGNVVTFLLRPSLELSLNRHWGMEASAFYVFRDFCYKYHAQVSSTAYDYRLGIKYRF